MGSVVSKDAKRQAERVAQNTEGVRDVRDRLKVADTSPAVTSAQ
jgi:osmotically-inducible protein OsmY